MMIKTEGLRKSFRARVGKTTTTVEAVRGVDLDVPEGEIFGFLGPNGAGKTTTLRMLATLIDPDSGNAVIAGADLIREPSAVRQRIGYVAQGSSTWGEVSAREELVLHARMYGIAKAEALTRAARLISGLQLDDCADRRCRTYSGGQRRRVDIALGLVHQPQVVFLDEPTTGLDPQSRAHLWDEIRRLRDNGMTIFLTTHYLDEADALCDRISIMDSGTIVTSGSPASLKRELLGETVTIQLAGETARATQVLGCRPYTRDVDSSTTDQNGLRLLVEDGASAIPQILRDLQDAEIPLTAIELHRPSLDDVFLAKTGRSLRDA